MEAPNRITLGICQRRLLNINEHCVEQVNYRRLPLDTSIQQPGAELLRVQDFKNNREPALPLNCVGKSPKNHAEPRLLRLTETALTNDRFGLRRPIEPAVNSRHCSLKRLDGGFRPQADGARSLIVCLTETVLRKQQCLTLCDQPSLTSFVRSVAPYRGNCLATALVLAIRV